MAENGQVMAIQRKEPEDILVSEKDLEVIIAEADKRVELFKKVLGVAIKRTNPKDWLDIEGNPYLGASGCEKVAPLFGVKMDGLSDKRDDREDDKGKYYIYTIQATFSWKAGSLVVIGTCSSRDKFFSWDRSTQAWKPLSETDETNIKKAAYSNLIVNGITRILGIRNLKWSDIEPFGIKREDVSRVEYATKKATPEDNQKQEKLRKMVMELNQQNHKESQNYLQAVTTFKAKDGKMVAGVSNVNLLTGKRLDITYSKIKTDYIKRFGPEVYDEFYGEGKKE